MSDLTGTSSAELRARAAGRPLEGVGPDTPTVENEHGAKQSAVPYRFDLIDAGAIFAMAKVLAEGAEKYGVDNWRGISVADHINHAIGHAYAYIGGDRSDDHMAHFLCRAMFAAALAPQPTQEG